MINQEIRGNLLLKDGIKAGHGINGSGITSERYPEFLYFVSLKYILNMITAQNGKCTLFYGHTSVKL